MRRYAPSVSRILRSCASFSAQSLSRLRLSTQSRVLAELALVRICHLEDLDELDGWTETYDYLVVWQPDEAYEAYAAERGVDPGRRTWTAEEYRAALLQAHEN